jgi:hypothetical protein
MNGSSHEILYQSLFRGPALCFPSTSAARCRSGVDDQARENYLYARAVVGVEYAYPSVCRRAAD